MVGAICSVPAATWSVLRGAPRSTSVHRFALGTYCTGVIAVTFFLLPTDPGLLESMQQNGLGVSIALDPTQFLHDMTTVPGSVAIRQIVWNTVLFLPLVPLLAVPGRWSIRRATIAGFTAIIVVEVLQLVVSLALHARFKSFDTADILLNSVGLLTGALVTRVYLEAQAPWPGSADDTAAIE